MITCLKQRFLHIPEQDSWGDCDRTTIACLLGCEHPEGVPHWGYRDNPNWSEDKDQWLRKRNLTLIRFGFPASFTIDEVLDSASKIVSDNPYLLIGQSSSGCNHVVICSGNKIIWDTSINNSGIVGPSKVPGEPDMWVVEILLRKL